MAEKGGYRHFMLKEIFEQPRAISDTLIGRIQQEEGEILFEELDLPTSRKWKDLDGRLRYFVPRPSHRQAYLRGEPENIPVETDIASEFRYRDPILGDNDPVILCLAIGRDGGHHSGYERGEEEKGFTPSPYATCWAAPFQGNATASYTPTRDPRDRGGLDEGVHHAGLRLLHAHALPRKRLGVVDSDDGRRLIGELRKIPHKIQTILDASSSIEEPARETMQFRHCVSLGWGINFPTVLEGALKLKEISYIHAEAYAAGEMKHGPIALIDENMPIVFVSPRDQTYKKTCSNMEEVLARKGKVLLFTDNSRHDMADRVDALFVVPESIYELQPILTIVPLQLMAYYMANLLGTDVDQPRNLAKSVTVE